MYIFPFLEKPFRAVLTAFKFSINRVSAFLHSNVMAQLSQPALDWHKVWKVTGKCWIQLAPHENYKSEASLRRTPSLHFWYVFLGESWSPLRFHSEKLNLVVKSHPLCFIFQFPVVWHFFSSSAVTASAYKQVTQKDTTFFVLLFTWKRKCQTTGNWKIKHKGWLLIIKFNFSEWNLKGLQLSPRKTYQKCNEGVLRILASDL